MPSERTDSHQFLPAAKEKGAVAALVHSDAGFEAAKELGLAAVLVRLGEKSGGSKEEQSASWFGKFYDAVWRLASTWFDNPSRKLEVVGVTGTNGKTSTCWMLAEALRALGKPCAYLGTLGFATDAQKLKILANTTPFALDLQEMLAQAVEAGCKAVAMEVSSHALAEKRVYGVEFDAAVYTNFTQDHLDYHGSMDAYRLAKRKLFEELPSSKPLSAVFNTEDPVVREEASRFSGEKVLFGAQGDLRVENVQIGLTESRFSLLYKGETVEIVLPLGGGYNVQNFLSVAGALLALGYSLETIREVAPKLPNVPGRFEAFQVGAVTAIVDYAHTPDALETLLRNVRELTSGKVSVVFGCGGDRDASKRPLMGKAAAEGADLVIITSDNPRTEDPLKIIQDIVPGIEGVEMVVEPDRPAAIVLAIDRAEPGDTVVVAGKGHEDYQIIGHEKFPMDDRKMVCSALEKKGSV